ncbi:MFS transporter [Geodermatophilus ruber]|uniref:Metabolite-proton symporter n=1 Tax=Geodermatophilus ruber TaxID=504800 RepID=A0A1I4DUM3_9ACTN|nr:MFS transporter [Geodermatophilus ruber]SFK96370.1 metabolite-proton symporter [Geodermatophilus ruber]
MADANRPEQPAEHRPGGGHPSPTVRSQRVKAAVASTVGTTIEWYDFFLYGTAAALVFPKIFFPTESPLAGTLASFSTLFVGFAARPVGAAIFGHYGDRIGRKAALIATLTLMGAATALMGLLPGYDAIGPLAPVLLVVLRIVQGIGVGGEWGGSVLLSMEWGSSRRRGFMASLPQLGVPLGLLLSTLAVRITSEIAGPAGFDAWGWRIPFLLSVVLVGIGLYVRLSILETPQFARLRQEQTVVKQPVLEVFRTQPRAIATSAFVRMAEQAPFYLFITFVLAYGTEELGLDRDSLLNDTLVAAAVGMITVPLFGHLSDRFGRRLVYGTGIVLIGLFAFPYYALLNTRQAGLVLLAIVVSLVFHDIMYGPQAALISETFGTGVRYSGAGLGYQLASVIAGGPAPLIAAAILAATGSSFWISMYIIGCAVISFVALLLMPQPHASAEEDAESLQRQPAA